MTKQLEPLYVVPILIEQPTWGGKYIAEFKKLPSDLQSINIGQSYELAAESLVYTGDFKTCFQLARGGDSSNLENINLPDNAHNLSDVIPSEVPLIKFTQAQENSYQLHVKEQTGSWQPKPESWYFFEEGYATLGITAKTAKDPQAYRARCEAINAFAQSVHAGVASGKITVQQARGKLADFINTDHPSNYVNSVRIPKNSVVDLSEGAVHHSWEAHADLPLGNIVYEVQKDVKDGVSTLRSFDQGKIKDDGSIRELTIPEYFQALETDEAKNDPTTLVQTLESSQTAGDHTFQTLFDSPHYKLIQATWSKSDLHLDSSELFQHIFVKEGDVTVHLGEKSWQLPQGWSMILPPNTNGYTISQAGTILITTRPSTKA